MNDQLNTRDLIADHLGNVKLMYNYLNGKDETAFKVFQIHFKDELTAMGLFNQLNNQ